MCQFRVGSSARGERAVPLLGRFGDAFRDHSFAVRDASAREPSEDGSRDPSNVADRPRASRRARICIARGTCANALRSANRRFGNRQFRIGEDFP